MPPKNKQWFMVVRYKEMDTDGMSIAGERQFLLQPKCTMGIDKQGVWWFASGLLKNAHVDVEFCVPLHNVISIERKLL